MPIVHSSPHPINDLNVDWNPKEDLMGNPYPNVGRGFEPGYDHQQWAGGESLAGRDRQPMSMPHGPVLEHASRFDTGTGRRGVHMNHPHRQAFSSDGRYPPHLRRARFDTESDEEEEDGEYFGEEDFEYDSYDDEEPVFPPKMGPGRGRAWDSSDGEEDGGRSAQFDEGEDYEEEDFDSYAADIRANMHQHGRGPMPRRGQPHQHQGGMRRSSPPPLESPPGSPPPLSRGIPLRRGMDPRMMRGRGGMMRGQGMGARMGNHGGGVPIPVRGGPPHTHGMPMHSGHVPMNRAHFPDSPTSSADGWAFRHGAARVRQGSYGRNFRKAMRWLKPNSTPIKLNHSLRAGTLLNPVARTSWDVRQLPVTVRPGVPVGFGRATFAEPASSPPVGFMRLLVPIPGLGDDQWTVDVWPSGSPYASVYPTLPSPYSFTGSPNVLAMSPVGLGPPPPFVRCADVLHALYTMLQRRARADEFYALDPRRAERVGATFWMRCEAMGAAAPPPLQQEELNRNVNSGVKRVDFLVGNTRWEGLEPGDADDEWIVRLGHM